MSDNQKKELNIFLSWSGERSRLLSEALRDWLPLVIESASPWLSQDNIFKGGRWSPEIEASLKKHKIGIICVTPENYEEPWIIFEAGALWKASRETKVCPLLLDVNENELEGPLKEFQSTLFEREDVLKLLKSLNQELSENQLDHEKLTSNFNRYWPELEKTIKRISNIDIPPRIARTKTLVKSFVKFGLPKPIIEKHAYFKSGFESHILYSTLTSLAEKRLFIFGRKNRKLFDIEHWDFFESLYEKMKKDFDFRVLFMDPESPDNLIKDASRNVNFENQLKESIENAQNVMKRFGLNISSCCRKYQLSRTIATIVADDTVIYSPITFEENGKIKILTRGSFNVVSADSQLGSELIKEFISKWDLAKEI